MLLIPLENDTHTNLRHDLCQGNWNKIYLQGSEKTESNSQQGLTYILRTSQKMPDFFIRHDTINLFDKIVSGKSQNCEPIQISSPSHKRKQIMGFEYPPSPSWPGPSPNPAILKIPQ